MASGYVTVYQVSGQSMDWSFVLPGLISLAFSAITIFGKLRFNWKQPSWPLSIFACCFGVIWLSAATIPTMHETSAALSAFQRGDYELVEGPVTDFDPMPYEGHRPECFSVQDRRFCYSDYEISPGFHNAASHGGPIRAGLQVRIAYVGNTILRLEVPADEVPSPAQSHAAAESNESQWQRRMAGDPLMQRMNTAFYFTAACWTLWWNLQWKRVMQFWLRPPNGPITQIAFRIFFLLNFLGAVHGLIQQIRKYPLTHEAILPTVETTVAMMATAAAVSAIALWGSERRRRMSEEKVVVAGNK